MEISYRDIIALNITGRLPQFNQYKDDQYKYLLNFVNDVLKYSELEKVSSVTEFKNIPVNKLFSDFNKLDNLVAKYQDQFIKMFDTDIEYGNRENDKNDQNDKTESEYLIDMLKIVLRCYDYKLISWLSSDNETILSIRKK